MATNTQIMIKDPDAVKPYGVTWADWLEDGETISTSTWIADTGITVDSSSKTDTVATVWLSGGTDKRNYTVTNRIVTSLGKTDDRSLIIQVRQQ
ncbi:MAG: hypothetical protein LCI00_16915 [Chloroflexi bacterium]|nr:hypothetical protein [Chloroflexota bacterium]